MLSRIYSFKFIIGFALLWLGAVAYGLTIYSTQVYRQHVVQAQIEMLQSTLKHETAEAIQRLYESQKDFAFKLYREAQFNAALEKRDAAQLHSLLGERYSRYRLAASDFRLKAIVVRDLSGDILVHSSDDGFDMVQ